MFGGFSPVTLFLAATTIAAAVAAIRMAVKR